MKGKPSSRNVGKLYKTANTHLRKAFVTDSNSLLLVKTFPFVDHVWVSVSCDLWACEISTHVPGVTFHKTVTRMSIAARATTLVPTDLCYGYIGAKTDTTQQSGQTPVKEVEIKNITVYFSGYTEIDTTGMLSPPTVWRFTVASDINSHVFDFYFLIWSLSRLLCCVCSGFNP